VSRVTYHNLIGVNVAFDSFRKKKKKEKKRRRRERRKLDAVTYLLFFVYHMELSKLFRVRLGLRFVDNKCDFKLNRKT